MPHASVRGYVDWDDDGTFTDPGEDVTGATLVRTPISIGYGRNVARATSGISPGELNGELDNRNQDYFPENELSPLFGKVRPGRELKYEATFQAVTKILYRGFLDDFRLEIGRPKESVPFSAVDGLVRLKGVECTTDLYSALTTGEAINIVLDAAGWPADKRDIDRGATTVPWFWLSRADAYDTLGELLASEGPPALITMGPDGEVIFRDRHHRLTSTASTTAQATFGGPAGVPVSVDFQYDHGWKDIVNSVAFDVPVRAPAGVLEAVWTLSSTQTIRDGETVPVSVTASDPFTGAVVPVAGVDFQVAGASVEATVSRTSGVNTTVFLRASGGTAVVTDLQLRAFPISVQVTRRVSSEDTTSIARYGRRSWPAAQGPVWASVEDAQAIADLILAQRAERLPMVRVQIANASAARLIQQLTRDLSDRVRIVHTAVGLDAEFFIERIEHEIEDGGRVHRTYFWCERVPEVVTNWFVFDSSTRGRFDVGTFGGIGLSEPGSVFRFDSGRFGVEMLGY